MSGQENLSKEVLTEVNKLATVLNEHQQTSENYYDKLNKLADVSADSLEKIGSLKADNEKQVEVIKGLEAQIARIPQGSIKKTNTGIPLDYFKVVNKALRGKNGGYGQNIDPKLIEEVRKWALNDAKITPYFADEALKQSITKDVIEAVNPQGGYWIIPDRSPDDVTREFESSPMRDICSVQTTNSNISRRIIDDNLAESGGWVGEQQDRIVTETARIEELDIPIHEQFAQPQVSHWMLDDAMFDLVGWVNKKSRQTMTLLENAAFINGNGIKKPRGILDYPEWSGSPVVFGNDSNYTRGALETIYSGASATFTYNGLVNIQLSLLDPYQPRAVWLTTRQAWALILQLKDEQERPLYQLANLLATGAQQVLLGKPVRIAAPSNAPTNPTLPNGSGMPVPATDSKSLIYGDFDEGYTIVDRIGFFTIVDMVTDKQFVKYYVRKRLGGALTSYQSLKVMQLSAPAAPLNLGVSIIDTSSPKLEGAESVVSKKEDVKKPIKKDVK